MPSASPISKTRTRLVCSSVRQVSASRVKRSRDSGVSPATGVAFSATTGPSLVLALYKGCGPRWSVSRIWYGPILSIGILILEKNHGHVVGSAMLDGALHQGFGLRLQGSSASQNFGSRRIVDGPIEAVGAEQNAVARFECVDVG